MTVNTWEYQYLDLMNTIMETGDTRGDRTGTGTKSLFGHQMRIDLQNGFPAITTKKLHFKGVVSELLWFLEGSTDERRLAEIHFGEPRSELIGKRTIWTDNADNQGKALGYVNNDLEKELGPVYGKQWRDFGGKDQILDVIDQIKNNPNSRRIILNAWNAAEIENMALPPCHVMSQFYVSNGKLHCQMYQRSCDFLLGSPFNIASYSLLIHMIAHVCNLEVGDFVYTLGDVHIYTNHFDQCTEQLQRTPFAAPKLIICKDIRDIDDFELDDFSLEDYECHPPIKAKMAI